MSLPGLLFLVFLMKRVCNGTSKSTSGSQSPSLRNECKISFAKSATVAPQQPSSQIKEVRWYLFLIVVSNVSVKDRYRGDRYH